LFAIGTTSTGRASFGPIIEAERFLHGYGSSIFRTDPRRKYPAALKYVNGNQQSSSTKLIAPLQKPRGRIGLIDMSRRPPSKQRHGKTE
jgi:hypothetical protein